VAGITRLDAVGVAEIKDEPSEAEAILRASPSILSAAAFNGFWAVVAVDDQRRATAFDGLTETRNRGRRLSGRRPQATQERSRPLEEEIVQC